MHCSAGLLQGGACAESRAGRTGTIGLLANPYRAGHRTSGRKRPDV